MSTLRLLVAGALCVLWPLRGQPQNPPSKPPPGDVFQTGSNPPGDVFQTGPKPGDVFQSGCDNDQRHFVRNGTFDRCAWDRAHYPCEPLTAQCGMPDHVPVAVLNDRRVNSKTQYLRCAVDACDHTMAVCWCPNPRPGRRDDNPNQSKKNGGDPGGDPTIPEKQREKDCDLQKLAALIMERYDSGYPIGRVQVVNSTQPTYLLLLPGMERDRPGQATMAGDSLIAWLNNAEMLDAYRMAIMDAVSGLPRGPNGANLILAGHSLGCMEAQRVVKSLVERWGYKVPQVICFGGPMVGDPQPGTNYLHVRAQDEPLVALDKRYVLNRSDQILRSNWGRGVPFSPDGAHFSYDKPFSGLGQVPMPQVSTLTSRCFELDLTTMQHFAAPDLMSRVLQRPGCSSAPAKPVACHFSPKAPLSQGACSSNPNDRGMLIRDENFLRQLATERCLTFIVRDSSQLALNWIGRSGYKPKPVQIKGKTLKIEDMQQLNVPESLWNSYLGLASARGMKPKDVQALWSAGYSIFGPAQLIVGPDGSKYYSDTDLHGVYDQNGKSAWTPDLFKALQCGTIDSGIQHGAHDDWPDRNNENVAKANYGPQVGGDPDNPKTLTAILPDGRLVCIRSLAQMKQLYAAIGVNFSSIYPAF